MAEGAWGSARGIVLSSSTNHLRVGDVNLSLDLGLSWPDRTAHVLHLGTSLTEPD